MEKLNTVDSCKIKLKLQNKKESINRAVTIGKVEKTASFC